MTRQAGTGYETSRAARRELWCDAIGWKGNYRIEGRAFVYIDQRSGRIITILGYPTAEIARLGLK